MSYEVNPFCVCGQKIIPSHNKWDIENVLVCAHFSSKLTHGTYC